MATVNEFINTTINALDDMLAEAAQPVTSVQAEKIIRDYLTEAFNGLPKDDWDPFWKGLSLKFHPDKLQNLDKITTLETSDPSFALWSLYNSLKKIDANAPEILQKELNVLRETNVSWEKVFSDPLAVGSLFTRIFGDIFKIFDEYYFPYMILCKLIAYPLLIALVLIVTIADRILRPPVYGIRKLANFLLNIISNNQDKELLYKSCDDNVRSHIREQVLEEYRLDKITAACSASSNEEVLRNNSMSLEELETEAIKKIYEKYKLKLINKKLTEEETDQIKKKAKDTLNKIYLNNTVEKLESNTGGVI